MSEPFDAAHVWAQIEDHLFPYLGLRGYERALYFHLVHQVRLRGQREFHITMHSLALGTGVSSEATRNVLRRLERKGCLRILATNRSTGHSLQVLLPAEIPGCLIPIAQPNDASVPLQANCLRSPQLRREIIRRDGSRCFYCLRKLARREVWLDHVIPRTHHGDDSFRNVVTCCRHCNAAKSDQPAPDFLRSLFRRGRISEKELEARLAALAALQNGRPA